MGEPWAAAEVVAGSDALVAADWCPLLALRLAPSRSAARARLGGELCGWCISTFSEPAGACRTWRGGAGGADHWRAGAATDSGGNIAGTRAPVGTAPVARAGPAGQQFFFRVVAKIPRNI